MQPFNEVLASIICIFLIVFKELWPFFMLLLLAIIIFTIVKIIIEYKKYGNTVFRIFKKEVNNNYDDETLINLIKKSNNYYRIIKQENSLFKFILITSSGIYAFYISNYNGLLYGEVDNSYLSLKTNIKQTTKVENFLNAIQKDLNNDKYDINKLIITRNNLTINVLKMKNIDVIKIKNLYYYFIKKNKNIVKYSNKEIDKIANELNKCK